MAIEQVLAVKDAEAKAAEIRRNAADETKKMMEDARQQVASIAAEAEASVSKTAGDVLAKAEQEAGIIYDSIILNAEKDCELLQARAEKNVPKAVSVIVERIVS